MTYITYSFSLIHDKHENILKLKGEDGTKGSTGEQGPKGYRGQMVSLIIQSIN